MLRGRARAGFTFVELMVVIAIIALMSSIIIVNLEGMTDASRTAAAARNFGNAVARVQNTAMLQGRALYIEVDRENQRWRIVDPPSPNEVADESEREEFTFYGAWEQLERGVHIGDIALTRTDVEKSDFFVVEFGEGGQVHPSGFVVYFEHDELPEESAVSVEVSGLTGQVAYYNGLIEPESVRDWEDF